MLLFELSYELSDTVLMSNFSFQRPFKIQYRLNQSIVIWSVL
jgi:hypothetical protein